MKRAYRFRNLIKGQGMVEFAGTIVISAMIVALTWTTCRTVMPVLFTQLTDSQAEHFDTP